MDMKEFKSEFEYELENGLDHAEWYEKEIKWMFKTIEQQQVRIDSLVIDKYKNEKYIREKDKEIERLKEELDNIYFELRTR